jgi:hypothetical protein
LRSKMSQAGGSRYFPSVANLALCESWSQAGPAL